METELDRLYFDSKNVLEATKFLLGSGSNEPGGILNIGGTGGLTTTQRVQAATSATYAVGDPCSARFIATSSCAYFYWRVGGGVVAPNALRYLEVL